MARRRWPQSQGLEEMARPVEEWNFPRGVSRRGEACGAWVSEDCPDGVDNIDDIDDVISAERKAYKAAQNADMQSALAALRKQVAEQQTALSEREAAAAGKATKSWYLPK